MVQSLKIAEEFSPNKLHLNTSNSHYNPITKEGSNKLKLDSHKGEKKEKA